VNCASALETNKSPIAPRNSKKNVGSTTLSAFFVFGQNWLRHLNAVP
jgi:hypothetical protein